MSDHGVPIDRASIERLAARAVKAWANPDRKPCAEDCAATLLALRDALDAAREKALEDAAQAADAVARDYDEADAAFIANGADYAAAAIRALKTKE